MIHGFNYRHSTLELFTIYERNLLPVVGIIYLSLIVQVKRCLVMRDGSLLQLELTTGRLREGTIKKRRYKKDCLKSDILILGAHLYKQLPQEIRRIDDYYYFKAKVKKFLGSKLQLLLKEDQLRENNLK
jgi:hypothetical protein